MVRTHRQSKTQSLCQNLSAKCRTKHLSAFDPRIATVGPVVSARHTPTAKLNRALCNKRSTRMLCIVCLRPQWKICAMPAFDSWLVIATKSSSSYVVDGWDNLTADFDWSCYLIVYLSTCVCVCNIFSSNINSTELEATQSLDPTQRGVCRISKPVRGLPQHQPRNSCRKQLLRQFRFGQQGQGIVV